MAVFCLQDGTLKRLDACGEHAFAAEYHLKPDGSIAGAEEAELLEGEGRLRCSEGFYVEPLEVQVDFLKAADAQEWIQSLLLRHIERVRSLGDGLWVSAEIKEEAE